jgi:monomeric isocitrate dehydrogenase
MRTTEEIELRIEKLRIALKTNNDFLKYERDVTLAEEDEILVDNIDIKGRIEILKWVLNKK